MTRIRVRIRWIEIIVGIRVRVTGGHVGDFVVPSPMVHTGV